MAVLNWSTLVSGSYAFDPQSDVLRFDDTTISAAAVDVYSTTGTADTVFDDGRKTVRLEVSALAITTTNVTFANGSRLIIGDNTTGTVNDHGANTLNGGSGNDLLIGAAGADTMNGGDGNDVFSIEHGYDAGPAYGNATLNGGNGLDLIFYNVTNGYGVNVDFANGRATGGDGPAGGSSVLTLSGIEWADGTAFNDIFTGSGTGEVFRGFGGNDTIDGGGNTDTALYTGMRAQYSVTLQSDGSVTVADARSGAPDGVDTLRNIEFLLFSDQTVQAPASTGGGGTGGSRPVISGPASQSVALNSPLSFGSFLAVADADGSAITKFEVRDNNATAGTAELYVNNAMQGQGASVESNSGALANIYVRSASMNATDSIQIRAHDGTDWGNWFSFNVVSGSGSTGGGGGGSRPVITGPASQSVALNSPVQFSSFLTVADADGSAITKFEVRDVNATAGTAELYVNNAMQGQGASVESNSGALANIYARSASMNATDGMQIRAHDGTDWGNWFSFNLVSGSGSTGGGGTGGSRPVITGPASHTVQANSPVQFSSFLTVADADGSAITKFEVRDVNATAGSAELYVNNAMQGQGTTVESNNGSLSTIYARSASMNATDGMQIRAHDGTNWGNWFNFNLVTTLAA